MNYWLSQSFVKAEEKWKDSSQVYSTSPIHLIPRSKDPSMTRHIYIAYQLQTCGQVEVLTKEIKFILGYRINLDKNWSLKIDDALNTYMNNL